MRTTLITMALVLLAAATDQGSLASLRPPADFKDRGALMLYERGDKPIVLIANADSANFALIALVQLVGGPVQAEALRDRPCLGVALFSKTEWRSYWDAGRLPEQLRPRDAALRLRLYAATAATPAAVQDIATGRTTVAIGLPYLEKTSIKAHLEKARGPCTAD